MVGCKCGEGCGTVVPECCGKDIYECETHQGQHTVCLVNQGCQSPSEKETYLMSISHAPSPPRLGKFIRDDRGFYVWQEASL